MTGFPTTITNPISIPENTFVVLYVDDQPLQHFMGSAALSKIKGIFAVHVLNGEEAIKLLQRKDAEIYHPKTRKVTLANLGKRAVDCIFMDILMPGMDGFETTKQIRSFNQNIPIVAHTSNYTEGESKQDYLSAGFTNVIVKNIQIAKEIQNRMTP